MNTEDICNAITDNQSRLFNALAVLELMKTEDNSMYLVTGMVHEIVDGVNDALDVLDTKIRHEAAQQN